MTEITKDHPYKEGGYLRNKRGAIATILEVVERSKPYRFKGLRVEVTEQDGSTHPAFLIAGVVAAWEITTEAPKKRQPAAEPVGEDAAHEPMGAEIAALEAEAAPAEDPINLVIAQLQSDLDAARQLLAQNHKEYEEMTDKWLDADENLRKASQRVADLEAENEELKETRDSAIDHNAAASDRTAEVAEVSDERPSVACIEVKSLFHNMGREAQRDEADKELARYLNQGWEKFFCGLDADEQNPWRLTTLTRKPVTPLPQPGRRTVSAVPGTQLTIQPGEASGQPYQSATNHLAEQVLNTLAESQQIYETIRAGAPDLPQPRPMLQPVIQE